MSTAGDEAADFAAANGLVLDGWQRLALRTSMGERSDGQWAAREVGIVVPRQNGKGSILEARELAGLYLLGERNIVHTAQQFRTASDGFKRIRGLIDNSPALTRRVKRILNSPIEKSIELLSGAKISFIARGPNAGRGLTHTDLLVFDEAYDLSEAEREALVPTMTTSPNPQVWYTSSAGLAHSTVLAGVRERGERGHPTLAYMEWSVPQPRFGEAPPDPDDPAMLAQANPSLGLRVSQDFLDLEAGSLSLAGRIRERLGVFDIVGGGELFPRAAWAELTDEGSQIVGPVTFAVEVSETREWSCVAAAGVNAEGFVHVESVDYRRGTAWLPDRVAALAGRHGRSVVVQPSSPAGSLIEDFTAAGVNVVQANTQDYRDACGQFYDSVMDGKTVRHINQGELTTAVRGATRRVSGDAFCWDRRGATVDITPLVAATLAAWGHRSRPVVDVNGLVW